MDNNKLRWFFNPKAFAAPFLTAPLKPLFTFPILIFVFSSRAARANTWMCFESKLHRACKQFKNAFAEALLFARPRNGLFLIHWIKESRFYLLCWTLEMTTPIQWAHWHRSERTNTQPRRRRPIFIPCPRWNVFNLSFDKCAYSPNKTRGTTTRKALDRDKVHTRIAFCDW